MSNREIISVLGKYKDKLFLSEEDILFLNEEDNEDLLIEYLRALFSGVTIGEVREMKEHGFTPDLVRRKAGEILGKLHREEDALTNEVQHMQERLEIELAHVKELNKFYEERLSASWEAERKALEAALASEREVSERLRQEVSFYKSKENRAIISSAAAPPVAEVPATRPKKKRFFQQQAPDPAVEEQYKKQMEYEDDQFKNYILMNPEYNKEQKEYLLSCFLDGMSYYKILRFAHPGLPVEFMQALKERRERAGY